MASKKGTALITGASSGIGAVYADRLAGQGYDLILVARSADKLAGVADRARSAHGGGAEVFPADLNDPADLARVEELLKSRSDITLLVNNAGVGVTGTFLDSDGPGISSLISLNAIALARLTLAITPSFVARGSGTIINIGSIVGVNPELLNGVYGGTKAFVLAFTQSLRQELDGTGVKLQVVLPGATATDIWGEKLEQLPSEIVMSAEDMVDAALAGLERGEFVTIPALQDANLWETYEASRQAMFGKLSNRVPASRYGYWKSAAA